MTRFALTMNMPSRSGNEIHQIIAEHEARGLREFIEAFAEDEFIIIEELYYVGDDKTKFQSRGDIALNYRFIGKIKVISSTGV